MAEVRLDAGGEACERAKTNVNEANARRILRIRCEIDLSSIQDRPKRSLISDSLGATNPPAIHLALRKCYEQRELAPSSGKQYPVYVPDSLNF